MPSTNRWLTDQEIETSKDLTRRNPQITVNHHYVPQMYLKRWATGNDQQIRYVDVNTKETDCVIPEAIASEPNFYQIETDDELNPDMWFETHMSRIEDKAAKWLRALEAEKYGRITNTNLVSNLAVFIGLQSQRSQRGRQSELGIDEAIGRFGAERILRIPGLLPIFCKENHIPYSAAKHESIIAKILSRESISSEAKPKAIDSAIGVWRNVITPALANDYHWWLIEAEDTLVTCDEPVLRIPKRRAPRQFPVSFKSATLIVFPVDPRRLLVLSRKALQVTQPFSLSSIEVKFLNRELAYNCNTLVFEECSSNIAIQLNVPPYPPAAQLPPTQVTTVQEFARAVLLPTRWTDASHAQQWPLARWTSA